jgi:hypothetical protein
MPLTVSDHREKKIAHFNFLGTVTVAVVDQGMQSIRQLIIAQAWNLPTMGPQFIK